MAYFTSFLTFRYVETDFICPDALFGQPPPPIGGFIKKNTIVRFALLNTARIIARQFRR